MNKKSIITYIVLALILLCGIGMLIHSLYKPEGSAKSGMSDKDAAERYAVLKAIPSDAAAVAHFEDIKTGVALLNDPTKVFGALIYDGKEAAMEKFLTNMASFLEDGSMSSLKTLPMALSLHFSGSMVPLVALEAPRTANDSTLQVIAISDLADSCGMSARFCSSSDKKVILVSSSETLVNSAVRHADEGLSILNNKDFMSCLAHSGSKTGVFFSNTYSQKLLQSYFKRPVSQHSDFFKSLSAWVGLELDSYSDESLSMKGILSSGKSFDAFANVLAEQPGESASFTAVVPSATSFAVSLPLNSEEKYLESYRKYLDASSTLAKNKAALNSLAKETGVNPETWAKALDLKEVVKFKWRVNDDSEYEALAVRVGKKDYQLLFKGLDATSEKDYTFAPAEYAFKSYASTLFGKLFSIADESYFAFTGEWVVSGSQAAIADFVNRNSESDVLQALLSDAGVNASPLTKGSCFVSYFSPGQSKLGDLLATPLLAEVNSTLDGAAIEPCFLTVAPDGLHLSVTRVPYLSKTSTPAVVADATIEIPQGPFQVKNSGTGETNLLAQQSNYYLSLKEESGKGIWSIPFSEPLCGAVESIDYYNNGKIQFLFAAGSKIYLLDRLGRFVGGFPVDLGKQIVLGPSAYDFTGAHGYSVVVLHADNTIGMYNIHGVCPDQWKGIASDEKIISLPELIKLGGKSYWVVRTAVQTQIFSFYGGEPVYKQSGAKSIRRDSGIEVVGTDAIKVTCNDGKTRNIKL